MRARLVSYLRLLGFSLSALAFAACVKLAATTADQRPEPQRADASPSDPARSSETPEADQLAAVQADLDAADREIANLRKALAVLGPLPDHPDLFIPVEMADLAPRAAWGSARRHTVAMPEDGPAGLFRTAEFGALPRATSRIAGLRPGGPGYEQVNAGIRLARTFAEDEALNALCVELSALAGPCRVAAPVRAW